MKRQRKNRNIRDLVIKNAEELRVVRTNMGFINKEMKSLMLTSYSPAEGKSTLVACMAATYAQQDKKVLIVDADFRRPTQYQKLELSNQHGLSMLLQESSLTELDDFIQETQFPNVYLLPAGPLPPNPTELLEKEFFKQIIQETTDIFDLVLIDAPPAGIADTQIVANIVDNVLVVVEDNRVKKTQLKQTIHVLEQADATIIGFVLNKVKRKKRSSNDYYYNY
ncbi:CpsD/CapB family tyrosine-protein kinase [Listeria booriae]|uniref:non-specific protein-tyrosine kinase n=1 Tax=Listeria booriae TaxID=1552123 RepID=A0A842F7V2_9LIST|nr:CpsD/CapB family tyrosine-protein kinase [Listeria booriae]MBC1888683.1 CpsD/CapB family tyrosine-protein kinase [Listeria booriae]MBC2240779.1 CpsD/CapB family tyrosine-protein kinase [Listeria booriae]MBC2245402.1 CpsD/CapB family tyrosine-protein kinase [Listeria booriae]